MRSSAVRSWAAQPLVIKPWVRGLVVLGCAVMVALAAAWTFLGQRALDPVYPGEGVARVARLSDYEPSLKGTPGDSEVYVLDSGQPGATVLVVGGTHPDEAAGPLTAVLLVETARVRSGRLLVIPFANRSAFTHNLPMEGHPASFEVRTPTGPRAFKYGARLTNPIDQWPDPTVFVDPRSRQQLAGTEARNLNRAYPGKPNGTLTQRVAYSITTLIRRERVDVAIDLHESSPEYPTINTIVAHDRAAEMGAIASMNLQGKGLNIGIELSPANLRGLSHREWGDNTQAFAFLTETPNPSQGRLRGRTDPALIVTGRDRMYLRLAGSGRLYVEFTDRGYPVEERVGRQVEAIQEILGAYNLMNPGVPVVIGGVPGYEDLVNRGLGEFIHPAELRR